MSMLFGRERTGRGGGREKERNNLFDLKTLAFQIFLIITHGMDASVYAEFGLLSLGYAILEHPHG